MNWGATGEEPVVGTNILDTTAAKRATRRQVKGKEAKTVAGVCI